MDLEGVLVEDQKRDTLLYAGKFQVRITDWFFFKEKADIKYVGLEDASIHLNRTDSVWNYHFLEQYFSSSDTSTKKSAGIQFDLKKVVMKNVSFNKKDAWLGNDMFVKVRGLDMDANKITISDNTVDVENLVLDDPFFSSFDYTGKYVQTSNPEKIKEEIEKEAAQWIVSFGNVKINNGRYKTDLGTLTPTTAAFDGEHIDFSKINGDLKNIGWTNDTISGAINLTAQERSGFVIKSLKAQTTIHPKAMIFDDLFLQTNRSTLTDYFAMHYDKLSDMGDFIHKVTMEAKFNKSTISSDDIAFFAPDLKTWKKNIKIDGDIKGTVDDISSKDLEVWAGNNTYVRGALSLVGLPNINETLINIEAGELRTTYADAVNFIPAIRNIETPDLNKLTYLRFNGTYTGFINDFVTYGSIQTNLGTLHTDLNMKFPKNGEPIYAGKISTKGFELGTFINSPTLGLIDFNGTVKGKGFKWQTLDMTIDGEIPRIEYGDYTYQNIKAKGNLTNRLFNGDFVMNDPNADLHLKGLVDLTRAKPFFNVTADIGHANLRALQITPQDIELSGKFDLNLSASSLSDLLGTARISNATLTSNGKRLSFDSLIVSSNYVDGQKTLTAVSNEFNATVIGDFDLQGLPDAFTVFLSRYYPSYIRAPRYVKPQIFTFDITTGVVEDYIRLIDTSLYGFNNSHITGSLNTSANTMTVDADVPNFRYMQYDFSDVQLKGSGDLEKLTLTGQVANAQIADSLFFPQTNFSIEAQNDVSDITIATTSNSAINQANLSAQIKTFSDGVSVLFRPSTFVLNGKTWTVEQGGELNFRKNTIVQGQLVMKESNQEIKVWTQLSDIGTSNDLHASLSNINLSDISPFLMKSNHLEGVLSGEIVVVDPQNKFNITSTLHANELRIDGDSIGRVEASVAYDNKSGLLTGRGNNVDPLHRIDFDLAMDFKDSANVFQDKINTRLTNFEMKYLNRFLGSIFSDIKGYLTGNFDIVGEGSNRNYLAKARIKDGSFKVNFSQVTYTIDDTDFEMTSDKINLNNIRIRDPRGYPALVTGYISHKGFSDMYYDIQVETESNRVLLLNTSYNDNQQFFGKAYGSGSFNLIGEQNDMLIDINVKASETDSSSITLPPSRTRESGQASFLVERKYGREMTPEALSASSNMHYDIHLAANPMVTVSVILDELTGDAIQGKGTGNLKISSGTSEPLTINGRYGIDEGNYIFTFQSLLKKPFILRENANNYIEWNGDPYDATISLDATYTAEKVSFAPLAGSGVFDKRLTSIRDDVNVIASLTGNLFHPNFTFSLEFPSNNQVYSTPEFSFALQQIEKNQNELNKQVTYLIVFNSFAPFETNTTSGYAFGELYYNTISGLLFGKVNEQLNKILSKVLQNNNATLNLTGSLYNRDLVDPNSKNVFRLPDQSNFNVSLGLPLFNDRAHFTIGATLDVPLNSSDPSIDPTMNYNQVVRLFPDVMLELMVNKTGSIKATFFYRENTDFLANVGGTGIPRRFGASIGYGKEFNSFKDLFRKKDKPKIDTTQKVLPESTSSN